MECFNGSGTLTTKAINFNIHNFNRCSYINKAIEQTNLHSRFKKELKSYYILDLIVKSNFKNAAEEIKSILKFPGSTTVVIPGAKENKPEPGILYTESKDIRVIVSLVSKNFSGLDDSKQETFLRNLAKINPWIKRTSFWTGDYKLNTKQQVISYTVEAGKALLIPEVR